MDDYKEEARKELARRELERRSSQNKPGLLERAANDVEQHINKPIESLGRSARDIAGGFAQGTANIIPGLANLGISGVNTLGGNVPKIPSFNVVPHSPSATTGEIGSFFTGPGFLKALGKLPEASYVANNAMKIPLIAQGIKHASNILGKSPMAQRVAGNAVLGGAYAPDNQLLGMGLGAAGGELGHLIGKGIKPAVEGTTNFLKNINAKYNPAAHQKELEHHLSQGANNITENSRQLATDIRNAHLGREQEAGIHYDYALNNAGHEPIYNSHSMILNKPEESEKTINLIKDLNVGELFNKFKSKPSFENAHALQSELGYMEREVKNRAIKTGTEKLELAKINAARNSLKNDINTFLERRDLTSNNPVAPHYKKASELFEANVVPYLSHDKLLEIVKDGKTVIKDLHTVFDTPANKITKEGIEKIGSINKIMKDLPENAKTRIIFDAMGGNKLSPQALMQKLNELKSKGYESYFTPEVEESINALGKKLKNEKKLKIGAGLAGTYGTYKGYNAIKHMLGG